MLLVNIFVKAIKILFSCRWRLVKKLNNSNIDKNKITKQIYSVNLFYYAYVDNLYEDIKKGETKDVLIFNNFYNNFFTVNTIHNMYITESAFNDIRLLNDLSEQAKTKIINYCNILCDSDQLKIISDNHFSVYLCRLLLVTFYMWLEYYDLLLEDILVFNNLVSTYDVTMNENMEFVDLYFKLAKIKNREKQEELVLYLKKLDFEYAKSCVNHM